MLFKNYFFFFYKDVVSLLHEPESFFKVNNIAISQYIYKKKNERNEAGDIFVLIVFVGVQHVPWYLRIFL